MSGPTPGPWRPLVALGRVYVRYSDAFNVADCGLETSRVAHANAHLIAAAPDLLQALREVEGDCYYLPNPGEVARCGMCQQAEGEPHEPECTMNFVLAAIAKAEGRPA